MQNGEEDGKCPPFILSERVRVDEETGQCRSGLDYGLSCSGIFSVHVLEHLASCSNTISPDLLAFCIVMS